MNFNGLVPVLVVNDTRVDLHHGCNRVMEAIDHLLDTNGMKAVTYLSRGKNLKEQVLQYINSVSIVIVNGEGTIHHDSDDAKNLLEVGAVARDRGVPAVLINSSWEANGPGFLAELKNFSIIALRDSRSACEIREAGYSVRVVPDLSLVPSMPLNSGKLHDRVGFSDNVDRIKALSLDRCRRKLGASVVSVAYDKSDLMGWYRFVRAGVSLRNDLIDPFRFVRLLRMRSSLWRESDSNTSLFIDKVSSLSLLVSGRFHACTIALAVNTPFVSQPSNTSKIEAFIQDVGLEGWRMNAELNPAFIKEAAAKGWSNKEVQARAEFLHEAKVKSQTLFSDIKALAL